MCRLAAYAGPPAPLSALLYDPPHSLEHQAYAPRELVSGNVNVDGTGVAWWPAHEDEPLVYVSERPPWSEPNLPRLAPRLTGSLQLAVVRSQTEGIPAGVASAHPFAYERWAGAHNGYIEGFDRVKWRLADSLDETVRLRLEVFSDSLLLFLMVMTELRKDSDADVASAMVAVAQQVMTVCGERSVSLNLVIASGAEVVALRAARGVEPNSLYHLENGDRWPGACLLASEPLDDDSAWTMVAADHLVRMTARELVSYAVDL